MAPVPITRSLALVAIEGALRLLGCSLTTTAPSLRIVISGQATLSLEYLLVCVARRWLHMPHFLLPLLLATQAILVFVCLPTYGAHVAWRPRTQPERLGERHFVDDGHPDQHEGRVWPVSRAL